jgi:hypothetical protein
VNSVGIYVAHVAVDTKGGRNVAEPIVAVGETLEKRQRNPAVAEIGDMVSATVAD